MNRKEFSRLGMALKTFYPRDNLLATPEQIELWYRVLQDIPYLVAETALKMWVCEEKWPPTIAELRAMAAELTGNDVPDWGEAWNLVTKAVWRFGYPHPEEAKEMIGPTGWKAVQAIGGWQRLCESDNEATDRANFHQCYEIYQKRRNHRQCCRRN